MTKSEFDSKACESYVKILEEIGQATISSDSIDPSLVKKIQVFLKTTPATSLVDVWNFYKELLDLSVHGALVNGFFLRLFNLEEFFLAPPGSFSQAAGNMDQAPWRSR